MKKFINENWGKALFFIIGAIVTILITKIFDKIIPNEPTIVKEVTEVSDDKYVYVSENYYEVKHSNNTIGIVNNLDKGSFVIEIGFIFKDELNGEYPKFYRKKCYLEI